MHCVLFLIYKVNYCEEAFAWYQDVNLVYLVDGVKLPYSQATLEAMYSYLDRHGELFWIEVKEKGEWFPIGILHYLRIISPL